MAASSTLSARDTNALADAYARRPITPHVNIGLLAYSYARYTRSMRRWQALESEVEAAPEPEVVQARGTLL